MAFAALTAWPSGSPSGSPSGRGSGLARARAAKANNRATNKTFMMTTVTLNLLFFKKSVVVENVDICRLHAA